MAGNGNLSGQKATLIPSMIPQIGDRSYQDRSTNFGKWLVVNSLTLAVSKKYS
jgi:hypothetical protein